MSKTENDLALAVLRELRLIRRSGGAPNAADADFVKQKYEGVLEELRDRGKVFWDLDAIPDRVFPSLTRVVAAECAPAFGTEYSAENAYQRLVILASDEGTGQPIRASYF